MLYNVLKSVITKKGYTDKNEAQSYVDVFYAKKRLTEEQYTELSDLVDTAYTSETATTA